MHVASRVDKAKLVEKQGRKTTDLISANIPEAGDSRVAMIGNLAFLFEAKEWFAILLALIGVYAFLNCPPNHKEEVCKMKKLLIVLLLVFFASTVFGQQRDPRPLPIPKKFNKKQGPYIAITHMGDYMNLRLDFIDASKLFLTAINGTKFTVSLSTYVIGKGDIYDHWETINLLPGKEAQILPMEQFPTSPEYVGETVVVVSSAPLIVTGAIQRGFFESCSDASDGRWGVGGTQIRTLDVLQFDCSNSEDRRMVGWFCENFFPPSSSVTPLPD